MSHIRDAQLNDLPAIVELCEQKRIEYEGYSPYFWRKAPGSSDSHLDYLRTLIEEPNVFMLVATETSTLEGFIIGAIITPPPVYAPGGQCCIIDDYNISPQSDWESTGKALLEAAKTEARKRGAVLIIVVCAQKDSPKRGLLSKSGLAVSSEWHVGKL